MAPRAGIHPAKSGYIDTCILFRFGRCSGHGCAMSNALSQGRSAEAWSRGGYPKSMPTEI